MKTHQWTPGLWDGEAIHRSILAGLLSQIGMQESTDVSATRKGKDAAQDRRAARMARNEYLGSRGTKFAIFPGSSLSRKPPTWVMAAQLVETSRLWARDVAAIEPEWAEELAQGIVKRTYSDPAWSTKRGAAMVREKVMLYGVPIVTERPILYSHVDRDAARDMFIRHALVDGQWTTHHAFWRHNKAVIAEVEEFYARTRATQLEVDDTVLYEFYDARLPDSVVSAAHFDRWWKDTRKTEPTLLDLHRDDLLPAVDDEQVDALYPTSWPQGDLTFPITYSYTPGHSTDGLTVHIPIEVLNRVEAGGFDWLVPGLLTELCIATIKSLPKTWRRQLVPAPDTARAIATWLTERHPSWADLVRGGNHAPQFHAEFTQAAYALRSVDIPADAYTPHTLPPHVRIMFSVEHTVNRGVAQSLKYSTNPPAWNTSNAHCLPTRKKQSPPLCTPPSAPPSPKPAPPPHPPQSRPAQPPPHAHLFAHNTTHRQAHHHPHRPLPTAPTSSPTGPPPTPPSPLSSTAPGPADSLCAGIPRSRSTLMGFGWMCLPMTLNRPPFTGRLWWSLWSLRLLSVRAGSVPAGHRAKRWSCRRVLTRQPMR